MGKLANRRRYRRAKRLWYMAQHDAAGFDRRLSRLVDDWWQELRERIDRLRREPKKGDTDTRVWQPVFPLVQEMVRELRVLTGMPKDDLRESQARIAAVEASVARVEEKTRPLRQGLVALVRGPRTALEPEQLARLKELLLAKAAEAQSENEQITDAGVLVHAACDRLLGELPSRCCFELARVIDGRMHRLNNTVTNEEKLRVGTHRPLRRPVVHLRNENLGSSGSASE